MVDLMSTAERGTGAAETNSKTLVSALSVQQALHLTSLLTDMISRHLLEQDAIAANPKWMALAYEAHGRLTTLHDTIGNSLTSSAQPAGDVADSEPLPEPLDPAVKG
jgi:hypothetical protein